MFFCSNLKETIIQVSYFQTQSELLLKFDFELQKTPFLPGSGGIQL